MEDPEKLRLYLGERIPHGGGPSDTFFSDDEIDMLLETSPSGIYGAAVLGWAAKAGEYARLIDMNESGGDRKLSQRYRQAVTQLTYYQGLADREIALATTAGRVVGRSVDWADMVRNPGFIMWTEQYNRMPILGRDR